MAGVFNTCRNQIFNLGIVKQQAIQINSRKFSRLKSRYTSMLGKTPEEKKATQLAYVQRVLRNNHKWSHMTTHEVDPDYFSRHIEGQSPKLLYIGCSDSRVASDLLLGSKIGEVFTHRNIANSVRADDDNTMAVFEYAINNLGVNNILITGHSRCGGVKASMSDESVGGVIGRFLSPVHELYTNNKEFLESIPDETERDLFLVELNIKRLVRIVSQLPIVKERWKDGKMLSVHGWIYRLETGELEDLGVTCTNGLKFDTEYLPELEAMGINL